LKLKLQTVAEKTAKNFRGLLYFAAPGRRCSRYCIYPPSQFLQNSNL